MVGDRFAITCNGRRVPLHPTGANGEFVAGVRYRAWQPPECLHPTIRSNAPLVFDLYDTWNERSLGGCTYHVAHPGGNELRTFPSTPTRRKAAGCRGFLCKATSKAGSFRRKNRPTANFLSRWICEWTRRGSEGDGMGEGVDGQRAHLDTTTIGKVFGEHTRPRVWSATPSSLTSGSGFSEGAEPRIAGRVRSPKSKRTRDVSDLANRVVVVSRCARWSKPLQKIRKPQQSLALPLPNFGLCGPANLRLNSPRPAKYVQTFALLGLRVWTFALARH